MFLFFVLPLSVLLNSDCEFWLSVPLTPIFLNVEQLKRLKNRRHEKLGWNFILTRKSWGWGRVEWGVYQHPGTQIPRDTIESHDIVLGSYTKTQQRVKSQNEKRGVWNATWQEESVKEKLMEIKIKLCAYVK